MSFHNPMLQCKDRGKNPRGAALWGGGCRPDCECGWNSRELLKAELQGLVLEKDGSSSWKTLYVTEGKEKDQLLNDLEAKAKQIKINKSQYLEPDQELLNGAMLINGEPITMLLFDITEEQEKELQEAFDDLMKYEAENS